jgi:hypothetical protein
MLEVSLIALDYSLGCFEFPNGSWPARPGLPYKQLIGKLRTEEAGLHITPLGPTRVCRRTRPGTGCGSTRVPALGV